MSHDGHETETSDGHETETSDGHEARARARTMRHYGYGPCGITGMDHAA